MTSSPFINMIGWKCQYGYGVYEIVSSKGYLRSFTPTDEGYFCLPQQMNLEIDFYNKKGSVAAADFKHREKDVITMGSIFNNAMGEDYHFVYGLPDHYSNSTMRTNLPLIFSSFKVSAPNLWSMPASELSGSKLAACYIPSLKKYIVYRGASSGYGMSIFSEIDGVETGYGGPPPAIYQFSASAWAYLGPVTGEGLVNPVNYKFLEYNYTNNGYYVSGFNTSATNFALWLRALFGDNYVPPDVNIGGEPIPDNPEGNIDVDGGLPGGYDPDSDEIPWDVPNWLSASDLGMCTVYNPTVSQVKALATRLYSKDFQSGFDNYIWGNPIESIIGLSVFPCPIPDGGSATVKSWGLDTGVTMTLAGSTLIHVNCGALPVPTPYEGYLDYSPYTQAEIYIPYVGFVGLDADDIMGQTLQLHYYIDIISGSATAKLVISNTSTTTVLGQWSCQVGRQIPVGSKDYNDIINAGVQLVAATLSAASGSVIPEIVTDLGDALQYEGGGFNGTKFGTQMLRAGSSAIMQAKPNITRGSAIASASGQLAVQYPYLILKRPVSAKTNGYGALVGYPTFKYGNIGSYSGFVRCQNIKLDGIGCTDWELSEIFRLCLEGVYI